MLPVRPMRPVSALRPVSYTLPQNLPEGAHPCRCPSYLPQPMGARPPPQDPMKNPVLPLGPPSPGRFAFLGEVNECPISDDSGTIVITWNCWGPAGILSLRVLSEDFGLWTQVCLASNSGSLHGVGKIIVSFKIQSFFLTAVYWAPIRCSAKNESW